MLTVLFGKNGCGKTSLLCAMACERMTVGAYDDLCVCRYKTELYNAGGANYTVPEKHVVYSNIRIESEPIIMLPRLSHYVDPARLAFLTSDNGASFLPPCSQLFLTEMQKYYDSRKSGKADGLPDAVSRWYEYHRHWELNVTMDLQRPKLLDLNIRALCGEFITPVRLRHQYDAYGEIYRTEWDCLVLFSCSDADEYMETGKLPAACETRTYSYSGNIFRTYKSRFGELYFLRGRGNDDYDAYPLPDTSYDVGDIEMYNALFGYDFDKPQPKKGGGACK